MAGLPLRNSPFAGPLHTLNIKYSSEETVFEKQHGEKIVHHWESCLRRNPALFNGEVLAFSGVCIEEGVLSASAHTISYAAFRTFMDCYGPETGLVNLFADPVVIGGDNGLLLGRMGPLTNDPGLVKFAGGTPDMDDVTGSGEVDIFRSAARELSEELGLQADQAEMGRNLWAYWAHPYLAIGIPFTFTEPVLALQSQARAFIAGQKDPELSDALLVTADNWQAIADSLDHTKAIAAHYLETGHPSKAH